MKKATFYNMVVSDGSKVHAYPLRVPNSFNLWSILQGISKVAKIEVLFACDSKAKAIETARAWNQAWADDGRLWLDAPGFSWVTW